LRRWIGEMLPVDASNNAARMDVPPISNTSITPGISTSLRVNLTGDDYGDDCSAQENSAYRIGGTTIINNKLEQGPACTRFSAGSTVDTQFLYAKSPAWIYPTMP
jgi:hypothetical protein